MKQIILSIFCLALVLTSCSHKSYYFIEGEAQGSTFHITYEGTRDYSLEIDSILKAFDQSLSGYVDNSIISRINNNDRTVKPDEWFTTVFNKSKEVYVTSDGMFDLTVGPLVKAWGFLKDTTIKHDSAHIKELLQYVGMDKVRIENGRVIKDNPNIIIDVNAIAQGFSVDVVSEFLEKQGSTNYLVEIGGELKAKGVNAKGKTWRIGIDKPIDGNQVAGDDLQTVIEITGKSLATSGNYRKFFVENGVKYAHTINPKTGYPAKNTLLSATIIADDCMTADAYATVCMASGLEKSLKVLEKVKGLEAYLIYNDDKGKYQIYVTEGLKGRIKE
jgi:FAD:protein FMN transferase